METEFRLVLLDLGHPMDINTIKFTVNTVEDVLALGLSFPQNSKEIYFGISILNSDFTSLQSESSFRGNFNFFHDNVTAFLKKVKAADKVTVPEYKYFLINSIELIFRACEEKLKTGNVSGKSRTALINVAILTRKTASILAYILDDVANKLREKFKNTTLMCKYMIVQILNEGEEERKHHGVFDSNPIIKWIKCSISQNDLCYFLKDWFLSRTQKLQILLSKEVNCVLQCEVDDCLVNPVSAIFDGNVVYNIEAKNLQPSVSESIYNLDIVNRIPVSRFSPTFVYGIPRRIHATCHDSTESQINFKMFKELCRELDRSKQGLLMMSKTGRSELIRFHFLTSDGCTLLMKDVTPDELYLPKNDELSKSDSDYDEKAALFVKNCIENITCVQQYSPNDLKSGLYEYLRKRLIENGQSKSLFGRFDPSVKLFGNKRKKRSPVKGSNGSKEKNLKPSTRKLNRGTEYKGVHPALLPSAVVEMYRKVPADAFKLTELEDEH